MTDTTGEVDVGREAVLSWWREQREELLTGLLALALGMTVGVMLSANAIAGHPDVCPIGPESGFSLCRQAIDQLMLTLAIGPAGAAAVVWVALLAVRQGGVSE
jgi:hypothetical protein